jgi:hypothetical protein
MTSEKNRLPSIAVRETMKENKKELVDSRE